MLVGKLIYDAVKQRQKPAGELSPKHVPYEFMSSINNLNIERPLKSNSQNSTFKGLSFKGCNQEKPSAKKEDKLKPLLYTFGVIAAAGLALRLAPAYKKAGEYSISEFQNFIKNKSGIEPSIISKHFEHLKKSELTKKLINVNGDKITFNKKTIPQLIWDGLVYPFKILPADILNGVVGLIGKIKPFKGWAQKTLKQPFFASIRQRSKIDAEVNSLRGLFEMSKDLKGKSDEEIASKMFRQSVKMFDPKTGNYDTKHERSLNRIVSGLPPAIFLANDAYNLSRMMDDDDKAAKHEQKARFQQEAARVLLNAYITLITFGALQKQINNSKTNILFMLGATTLVTEATSRLINGKHITRLTPEQARKENEKNHAPEAEIKPDLSFKSNEKPKDDKQQKPLLTFKSALKALGVLIAGGFAVKGLRKINAIDSAWNNFSGYFTKKYKKLTQIEDFKIKQQQLDDIIQVLKDNGFKQLAEQYQKVAQTAKNADGTISLGKKDKKIKPAVNFFIAPFKFVWKYATLPYKFLDSLIFPTKKAAKNGIKKSDNIAALAKSIENIGKEAKKVKDGKLSKEKFQSYVRDNIMKAFNADTLSNIANSELSNLAKTAASLATVWFLMTDNYNMVMLKSNGNDVEGAKTKFTERAVQEASRLFYQTLLIDLFNSTFKTQYNKSLYGMSWITLTNTTMGEWLTRKSVGVPVGTHSRDSLLKLEEQENNATGFKRKYFDFMKRLTGKRAIKTYEVPAKNPQPSQNVNFTSSTLEKMIKAN